MDVAQLVDYGTGTPPTQVRFPAAARDFSPGVNFQCRLSNGVRTPPRAQSNAFYICAHVKDPIVHVRVRWIMETLKHPAWTLGWIARLYRNWLSPGKATEISHGKKSQLGQYSGKKKVVVDLQYISGHCKQLKTDRTTNKSPTVGHFFFFFFGGVGVG